MTTDPVIDFWLDFVAKYGATFSRPDSQATAEAASNFRRVDTGGIACQRASEVYGSDSDLLAQWQRQHRDIDDLDMSRLRQLIVARDPLLDDPATARRRLLDYVYPIV